MLRRGGFSASPEIHAKMHRLRIWRNASEHHDEQRWACDGPRSAEEAAQLIEELASSVDDLMAALNPA